MKVAIDGPAGSGKSTVAHALADACGLVLLDTGAMYRSVTLACLGRGVDLSDEAAVTEVAESISIAFGTAEDGTQTVSVDGADVTAEIRTPEIDKNVSAVSAIAGVREAMVAQQRALGSAGDVVAEGRDIGTVVFPDAEVKVFLTADPAARAHRRAVQRAGGDAAKDPSATADAGQEEAILADLKRRDEADSTRAVAPLKPAENAVHIDSSTKGVDEVVATIAALVNDARKAAAEQAPATDEKAADKPAEDKPAEQAPAADDKPADEPKAKPAKKADKDKPVQEGPMSMFAKHEDDEYYEHAVREFPLQSRALLAAAIGVCGAASKVLWHWKLEEGERLWDAEKGKGMVIAMNHVSMIDPVLIAISGWAHGRRVRPIYKSELDKHKLVTWFFARIGAIPVKRDTADIKVVRRAQRALQRGDDVLVFPEGTRIHSDDQEVTIHGGFALMAQLAKAPVLPIAIVGARDGAPGGNKPLRPGRIWMRTGEPLTFDQMKAKGRKKQAKEMEERAMERVYALRDALRAAHPGKM